MTQVETPTFLLEDRHGEIHEVSENDRVLVLAGYSIDAHDWVRGQGQIPIGSRWVLVPPHGPRVLQGARFDVIVTLPSFDLHPDCYTVRRLAEKIERMQVRCLRIEG